MLAATLLLLACPQVDWIDAGGKYLAAWRQGRVDLLAPEYRANPRFLDGRDEKIQELTKARGKSFYWTEEAELSFLCSGLAAAMGNAGTELLLRLGRVRVGKSGRAELTGRASERKQPWLVRQTVLRTIANGNNPSFAARAHETVASFGKKKFHAAGIDLACAVLAVRGEFQHRAACEALLRSDSPRHRVAALHALGGIGATLSLGPLARLLDTERDPGVRCALWKALGHCVAALGKPGKREKNETVDTIVTTACDRLADRTVSKVERLAICRFLWDARPLGALRELPEVLAAEQHGAGGDTTLRWWTWSLLQDMHGTGTARRKSRSGKLGTGFSAGEDEPDEWRAFLAGRRKLYALDRGREVLRPPYPGATPKLFNLPLRGARLLFLVDCSAAGAAKPAKEDRTVLGKITAALSAALAELPEATEVRIVGYSKAARSWPKRGYARLDKKGLTRARAFLAGLKPSGTSDHARELLAACGLESAELIELAKSSPDGPDNVYWLVTSPPTGGRIQSPTALVDVALSAQATHPLPFHIAYFRDHVRRSSRDAFRYRLRGVSTQYRRLGTESRGSYEYVR